MDSGLYLLRPRIPVNYRVIYTVLTVHDLSLSIVRYSHLLHLVSDGTRRYNTGNKCIEQSKSGISVPPALERTTSIIQFP